jgi:hypothetical protein
MSSLRVAPYIDASAMTGFICLGRKKIALVELSVTMMRLQGNGNIVKTSAKDEAITTKPAHAQTSMAFSANNDVLRDSSNPQTFTFSFKSRFSRLHRQCLALVSYYAGVHGVPRSEASLEHVWRYYRDSRQLASAEVIRMYFCRSFKCFCKWDAEFPADSLTAEELESLVSDDNLQTNNKEITVLRSLIAWAKEESKRHPEIAVGQHVRLKHGSHRPKPWQDADCVVKNIEGLRVEVQRVRGSEFEGSNQAGQEETIKVPISGLHDAGQTALAKMLKHVRIPFISICDLRTCVPVGDYGYICDIAQWQTLLQRVLDVSYGKVQIYKLPPTEGKGRTGYTKRETSSDPSNQLSLWLNSLMESTWAGRAFFQRMEHHALKNAAESGQAVCDGDQNTLEHALDDPEAQRMRDRQTDQRQSHARARARVADLEAQCLKSFTLEQLEAFAERKRREKDHPVPDMAADLVPARKHSASAAWSSRGADATQEEEWFGESSTQSRVLGAGGTIREREDEDAWLFAGSGSVGLRETKLPKKPRKW